MKLHIRYIAISILTSVLIALSFGSVSWAQLPDSGVAGGAASARGNSQPADLFGQSGMFSKITNILLFVIGAISVIMIIIGGLRYILSGGDSANVTAAKNTILYAIVGIVVALLAYAAVNFVVGSFAGGGGVDSSSGGGSATSF